MPGVGAGSRPTCSAVLHDLRGAERRERCILYTVALQHRTEHQSTLISAARQPRLHRFDGRSR